MDVNRGFFLMLALVVDEQDGMHHDIALAGILTKIEELSFTLSLILEAVGD